ncbi:hypothetical protein [Roseovarius pacificus]|uniref:hypothetical protein n=1 Tax=Roseovarius pacificus TaxID=337701 RepID=UPI0040392C16
MTTGLFPRRKGRYLSRYAGRAVQSQSRQHDPKRSPAALAVGGQEHRRSNGRAVAPANADGNSPDCRSTEQDCPVCDTGSG